MKTLIRLTPPLAKASEVRPSAFDLRPSTLALALLLLSTFHYPLSTSAQGTAFTYQGRLSDNGAPANGAYNLRLTLYDASTLGNVLGVGSLTNAPVAVSNGLFTVLLDFGPGVFTGSPVWLQMDVSSNTVTPAYVSLSTRQQLTPAPYAIYSENAGEANSVNTNGVSATGLNTLGAPSSGQVLTYNGSSLIWTTPSAGGGGGGWSLSGNDGSGAFLGTTNNYPLRLVVNDLSAGTFWPFANGSVSVALGTYNTFTTLGNGGNFLAGGGNSGGHNYIYTDNSSIGGGYANQIDENSPGSVIAGGVNQRVWSQSFGAVIGGGAYNTISNNTSGGVIPGGLNNLVSGDYGFAAGNTAQAIHSGAFVWADNSAGGAPFGSTSNNQFSVRAAGGVRFVTAGAGVTIDGVAVPTQGVRTDGAGNTASGLRTLDSNPSGRFNTADGFAALESNTTGSFNTANGYAALSANLDGSYNTANGAGALEFNASGSNNTANGSGALSQNLYGHDNTANGYSALSQNLYGNYNTANGADALNFNQNGSGNTASGYWALYSNDSDANTADGYQALYQNTSGRNNTANGYQALYNNTDAYDSTASGYQALFANDAPYNTAAGFQALFNNADGWGNTAVGAQALYSNTDGQYNTAIGVGALYTNTGHFNIALGQYAGANLTSGNYNIDIGNSGQASDYGAIRIGDTGAQTTFIAGIYGAGVAGGVPVYVAANGQLGTLTSSRRYKDNIQSMADASDVLLSLRPVTFHYKQDIDPKGIRQFGLIAEEVDHVCPDLVVRDAQHGIYTVRYEAVNAMLLNEFLKAHRKVEDQGAELLKQQHKVQEQEQRLNSQTAEIQGLKQQLAATQKDVAARLGLLEKAVALKAGTSRTTLALDDQPTEGR